MTDLRKAAEQALEALEQIQCFMFHPAKVFQWEPSINALRAALAQEQVEPVACTYPQCQTTAGCGGACCAAIAKAEGKS